MHGGTNPGVRKMSTGKKIDGWKQYSVMLIYIDTEKIPPIQSSHMCFLQHLVKHDL